MTSIPDAPELPDEPSANPSANPAAALPEPRAGGNYLRDPVTGALSLNPAYPAQPDLTTPDTQE